MNYLTNISFILFTGIVYAGEPEPVTIEVEPDGLRILRPVTRR